MTASHSITRKFTALLVYGRPPLVFGGMVCAVGVMWNRSPILYLSGVVLLFISMTFDMVDGWFATRYPPHPALTSLADRIMDKVVYSIIFPLLAAGMMWRLIYTEPGHSRTEMLHAILVLFLCITVLVRDSFAHFLRNFAIQKGVEPDSHEFRRLRTMIAAPVSALLYVYAFYLPAGPPLAIYGLLDTLANLPLRFFFIVETIFLIVNFWSIAALCRKYGTFCLDEVCHKDDLLRRRILSFFPNSLTVMNALMGLLAVFFAQQGRLREAFLLLIGAAIFDKLDGAVARKLGLTEPIDPEAPKPRFSVGGIMDDIADGMSFCLVPALIFYITLTDSADPVISQLPLTAAAGLYALLGIGRLTYFTLDRSPIPGFFKGLPTTAAAPLVTAPVMLYSQAAADCPDMARFWAMASFALLLVAGMAMNLYFIHYLHLGRFMDRRPWFGRLNLLLLISFVLTPYFGYVALAYLLLYLFSPLFTWRLKADADRRPATPPASQTK